jgi:hypothetical protein
MGTLNPKKSGTRNQNQNEMNSMNGSVQPLYVGSVLLNSNQGAGTRNSINPQAFASYMPQTNSMYPNQQYPTQGHGDTRQTFNFTNDPNDPNGLANTQNSGINDPYNNSKMLFKECHIVAKNHTDPRYGKYFTVPNWLSP